MLMFLTSKVKISIESVKWILGHMIFKLAKFHFIQWVNLAKQFSENKVRPPVQIYEQFTNQIPFIGLSINVEKIYFFYWENESSITQTNLKLECPYNKQYYKTIHDDESSHLPMRLAIISANILEKKAAEKYLLNLKVISMIK
jgi:hypothetical protein